MNEKMMRRLAKPMLFAAAFIWGSSFFIMKDALDALPVQYLLAIRFTAGAVLLGLLCWKKWRIFTPDYLWRGAAIGGFLYLAYSVQTYGLALTTPSKNAFLTAVYCVLVPFLYWAFAGVRPDRYNVIAAVLCVILSWLSLGLPVAGSLKNPAVCACMCLILQLTIMLLGLDIFVAGLRNLLRGRPDAQSLVSVSCLASIVDACVVIYTHGNGEYLPFCVVSGVSMCFAIYGAMLYCRGQRYNFRVLTLLRKPNSTLPASVIIL